MDTNLKNLIEDVYDIQVTNVEAGPRQFVAETFILSFREEVKYFVKVIKYNKYPQRTLESLPILKQLIQQGIENINYPIETKTGELYVLSGGKLIILFNYIKVFYFFSKTKDKSF